MLFDKNIEPSCSYCIHGAKISDTEVICVKKGVVSSGSYCRKFSYDPISRAPSRPVLIDTSEFSEDDFKID